MHKPSWYQENKVLIVNAATCGINKDGHEQYIIDPETGFRSESDIDDALAEACDSINSKKFDREDVIYHDMNDVIKKDIYVPKYFNENLNKDIKNMVVKNKNLTLITLGELVEKGFIEVIGGHGSPSSDQRVGEIPYIKVSDLRAGAVNINPTNMIPITLAKQYWKGNSSGLKPYDLISPERASKNIGEFCVLMPGQQNIVLTKEVIIVRATLNAGFNQFYLMWALSLGAVRKQWERIVFMQTNREDVGKRMYEIILPYPNTRKVADELSRPFESYYESLELARNKFIKEINASKYSHHIHLGESF